MCQTALELIFRAVFCFIWRVVVANTLLLPTMNHAELMHPVHMHRLQLSFQLDTSLQNIVCNG